MDNGHTYCIIREAEMDGKWNEELYTSRVIGHNQNERFLYLQTWPLEAMQYA